MSRFSLGRPSVAPRRPVRASWILPTSVLIVLLAVGDGGPSSTVGRAERAHHNAPVAASPIASQRSTVAPPATPSPGSSRILAVPGRNPTVSDAAELVAALSAATPGETITLRDGAYLGNDVKDPSGAEPGRFLITRSGTASAPIILRGSRAASLDGGGSGGGYAIHLKGASYWRLEGFTVRSGSKGIVLDQASHNVIDGVRVTDIGQEGVHFRDFSTDNVLRNSVVDSTGVKAPNFGEGVYLGSAVSNWPRYSGGLPDRSDRNQVLDNRIFDTGAEDIDVKEGSTGGTISRNYLGGDRIQDKNSADSWIDVKGNGYLIEANHGHTSPRPLATSCGDPKGDPSSAKNPFCDGLQVHVAAPGWGSDNVFAGNVLDVNAPGVGIWLQNSAVGQRNIIRCDNVVSGAAAGNYATNHYATVSCTP
jgi:Right handed beta helix region